MKWILIIYRNTVVKDLATDDEMQGSIKFFRSLLRLPIYPTLTTEERDKVVAATRKVMDALY